MALIQLQSTFSSFPLVRHSFARGATRFLGVFGQFKNAHLRGRWISGDMPLIQLSSTFSSFPLVPYSFARGHH